MYKSYHTRDWLHKCLELEVYRDCKTTNSFIKRYLNRYILRRWKPSTRIVYLFRKIQFFYHSPHKVFRWYSLLLYNKIWRESGCCLSPQSKVGIGLTLPHPVSIVIGAAANIGDNVRIYQHVSIGSRRIGDYKLYKQPKIGNNVVVFSDSSILGDIHIADGTIIGAKSLVLKDTLPNRVYAGQPAVLLYVKHS